MIFYISTTISDFLLCDARQSIKVELMEIHGKYETYEKWSENEEGKISGYSSFSLNS